MSTHVENSVNLNLCLFNQLAATAFLDRSDCVQFVNPRNADHQQSNVCFVRNVPGDKAGVVELIRATERRFKAVGVQPRYTLSPLIQGLDRDMVRDAFASCGYAMDFDVDMIMACTRADFDMTGAGAGDAPDARVRRATLDDVPQLVQLFAAAFGYGDQSQWLHHKLTAQLQDPQVSIFVLAAAANDDDAQQELASAVILNEPDGLPHLMHVNVAATHPAHQRKGLGLQCISAALAACLSQGQTAYLEVYDEISHAQRMYERTGFKHVATLDQITAYPK
ncbi:acyl-CoA N-acyltransferase [Gongronella butleri]|nr:acyl-CoA N-acyltransferase [Gongronella butleri]